MSNKPASNDAKDTPESVLRSLLADIEAMRNGPDCFGPFHAFTLDYEKDDAGVTVSWPNLTILLRKVKGVLGEAQASDDKTLYHVKCISDGSYMTTKVGAFSLDRSKATILTREQAGELGFPDNDPIYQLVPVPTIHDEDGTKGPVLICCFVLDGDEPIDLEERDAVREEAETALPMLCEHCDEPFTDSVPCNCRCYICNRFSERGEVHPDCEASAYGDEDAYKQGGRFRDQ